MSWFSMRRSAAILPAVLACGFMLRAAAGELEVAGVRHPETIEVQGTRLVLNGAGIRYKAVFKVYTAGLYLGSKAASTEAVLAAPGAKRLTITMLRDIDANEFGKLFTRGVEDNTRRSEMAVLIPGLLRMGDIFAEQKRLHAGDRFTVDWLPGSGTVVAIRGVPQGEPIREPGFFDAMLRIWLGPAPADWHLKEALLGRPA